MPFYKNVEVRDLYNKYGDGNYSRALFAKQTILPGELIWYCECGEEDEVFTKEQLLNIINKRPKLEDFLCSFSYMVDDDVYALPSTYQEEKNNDEW